MKLPDLRLKFPDLPRPVAISAGVIVLAAVSFGFLLPSLGAARDNAVLANGKLKADIAQATKSIDQVQADTKYVNDNREKFEALLQSDRLVPHTRRDATERLRAVALQDGLSALSWQFSAVAANTPAAAASQVKESGYRTDVEAVTVTAGAALDGRIYKFIADLGHDFPGAAVVQSVSLARANKITSEMLAKIGQGGDAGLVTAEIKLLWRTAEANDTQKKTP